MFARVCVPLWGASLATLLLANLRTVTLLQTDTSPRRCHSCDNSTACREPGAVLCPPEKPWCSTVAAAPNVTSSLGCAAAAAVAAERACLLAYCAQKQRFQMTCVCATDLCNAPFSPQLLEALLHFASNDHSENNSTDLTDAFFNSTKYANVTKSGLFAALTAKTNEGSTTLGISTARPTTVRSAEAAGAATQPREAAGEAHGAGVPRAEALKQEAAPSDDDEDEGEGSGDEERPRAPPAAPQPPSSYLPASENGAAPLYPQVLVTTSLFLFVKV
ncbi:hypothetical protein JYU34_005118 [Plutella xylostella]|uniref:Uncharacterized protein n=1 Tax=Plutella xylostella TaxID=51655 RepID=A0ABQ7QVX5_PLUXY|nr:hypothetical protein JYU34_005118 [Plutella xylostella]